MEIIGRVLLIEQKKCDRDAFPRLLKELSFETEVAENFEVALDLLINDSSGNIDAIILSCDIIKRDYLDIIEWIKKIYPDYKLIVTSCRPEDESICNVLKIQYVRKPIVNFHAMNIALSNALLHKKARGAQGQQHIQ